MENPKDAKEIAINDFNPDEYLGLWYEIARVDSWFEGKNIVSATATYKQLKNSILVINKGITDKGRTIRTYGIARRENNETKGILKVSFFPWATGDYIIIMLTEDYSVVVSNNYKNIWILSRTEKLEREKIDQILSYLHFRGIDYSKLHFNSL